VYDTSTLSLTNSIQAHSKWISRIKQSPFNNYVATCSETIKIWNVSSAADWPLIRTYSEHSSLVLGLDWFDADTLVSGGADDGLITIWSVSTGVTKRSINVGNRISSLKMLNNRIHLAVGLGYAAPYDIKIYNVNDDTLVSTLQGHTYNVNDLIQLNENGLLVSASSSEIRVWDLKTSQCKYILQGQSFDIKSLKQINSEILASGAWDRTIMLWNLTTGKAVRTLNNHTGGIYQSIDLVNNCRVLVSGSSDQTIKLWNWSTGECSNTIKTNSFFQSLAVINYGRVKTTLTFGTWYYLSFFERNYHVPNAARKLFRSKNKVFGPV
jgi:WD40 repeat protein